MDKINNHTTILTSFGYYVKTKKEMIVSPTVHFNVEVGDATDGGGGVFYAALKFDEATQEGFDDYFNFSPILNEYGKCVGIEMEGTCEGECEALKEALELIANNLCNCKQISEKISRATRFTSKTRFQPKKEEIRADFEEVFL